MGEIISEKSTRDDERMVGQATTYTRIGGIHFCGDSATGSFYGAQGEVPSGRINFSNDASVWVDNGYGGTTSTTLGEWIMNVVTEANSKVDAILRAYESDPNMASSDVDKGVTEVMDSMYADADALWSIGDGHSSRPGMTFISLGMRDALRRGIKAEIVDAPQTARDAVNATRTQVAHAALLVSTRANELLQSIQERDASEHADEYEKMLKEFKKESAKDQLRSEILAISDPAKRSDAMRRYSRAFTK